MKMSLYKKILLCMLMFSSFIGWNMLIYAETSQRQWNPMQMLDNFAWKVNKDDRIQDTALNDISNIQWKYASEYKITNTLDSIRIQIAPYIQRTMYIGLSIAVLWVIYNWFLMVTNSLHWNWDLEKVKGRMTNIAIWVWLLTWFYVIIQIILAIISYLLN